MTHVSAIHLQIASFLLVKRKHFDDGDVEMPRKPSKSTSRRRSPCPISCALDLFGDRWTLLVVRDLLLGRSRFKDFSASPESIPTNILSDRLERLVEGGIAHRIPAADGSKRLAYALTKKGEALRPVLASMRDWGLEWEKGTLASLEPEG